jgi:hypothetical protein
MRTKDELLAEIDIIPDSELRNVLSQIGRNGVTQQGLEIKRAIEAELQKRGGYGFSIGEKSLKVQHRL